MHRLMPDFVNGPKINLSLRFSIAGFLTAPTPEPKANMITLYRAARRRASWGRGPLTEGPRGEGGAPAEGPGGQGGVPKMVSLINN